VTDGPGRRRTGWDGRVTRSAARCPPVMTGRAGSATRTRPRTRSGGPRQSTAARRRGRVAGPVCDFPALRGPARRRGRRPAGPRRGDPMRQTSAAGSTAVCPVGDVRHVERAQRRGSAGTRPGRGPRRGCLRPSRPADYEARVGRVLGPAGRPAGLLCSRNRRSRPRIVRRRQRSPGLFRALVKPAAQPRNQRFPRNARVTPPHGHAYHSSRIPPAASRKCKVAVRAWPPLRRISNATMEMAKAIKTLLGAGWRTVASSARGTTASQPKR